MLLNLAWLSLKNYDNLKEFNLVLNDLMLDLGLEHSKGIKRDINTLLNILKLSEATPILENEELLIDRIVILCDYAVLDTLW